MSSPHFCCIMLLLLTHSVTAFYAAQSIPFPPRFATLLFSFVKARSQNKSKLKLKLHQIRGNHWNPGPPEVHLGPVHLLKVPGTVKHPILPT